MKKFIPSALLAMAVSGFLATSSFAGCTFGLCYNHCGCCGCGAKFCVRQYNAFSPVCSGTVFCDGCCPFGAGIGPGYGGAGGPCAGGMCPGGGCGVPFSGVMSCPPGCDGCLGSLPPSESSAAERRRAARLQSGCDTVAAAEPDAFRPDLADSELPADPEHFLPAGQLSGVQHR